jgi:branched-chain amino acid transport system ATP-binding protein
MSAVLECVGVQRSFGGFLATNGIDLKVEAGEFVGIIGANGAGKTTLLNIVSGYLKPTAGRIMFAGQDVTGTPPRRLARAGVARSFQIPQLFPRSTARENMMLALSLLREPQSAILRSFNDDRVAAEADQVLASYGLGQHADALVSHLPQGVRKLLDIAMATCASPKLVLLDEPTSGVSSEEKNDLMKTLSDRFRASGTTVVFIEHDMDIVGEYASRVVALFEGKVICDGLPDVVFADAQVIQLITGRSRTSRSLPC